MKSIFAICFLVAGSAFADVTIIKSPVMGRAINGPDNKVQIFNPYIADLRSANDTYAFLKADWPTAAGLCGVMGKQAAAFGKGMKYTDTLAAFDSNGVLSYETLQLKELEVMISVVCQ